MLTLPGILTAFVFGLLAYFLVIASMNFFLRRFSRSASLFPVLPRISAAEPVSKTATDFEQFVMDRFDPGHFRLMQRLEKTIHGTAAGLPEFRPDLEYQALIHDQVIPFAIECKWRPQFTDGLLDFPAGNPLPHYRQFSMQKGVPVFLLIGVGGNQTEPEHCYILPVDVIPPHFTFLSKKFLDHFRRTQPDSVLFLDTRQMMLR